MRPPAGFVTPTSRPSSSSSPCSRAARWSTSTADTVAARACVDHANAARLYTRSQSEANRCSPRGRALLVSDVRAADFFTDRSLVEDPFPYYEFVRSQGLVWQEPHHGAFV